VWGLFFAVRLPKRSNVQTFKHSALPAILLNMGKQDPPWLQNTRDFCQTSGIKIVGWGPDLLTVEAKSDARASEIASQLAQLGFKPIPDEDNAYAGLLDLSKNPQAIQAEEASLDVSRRLWDEQITPFIWALGSLLLFPGLLGHPGHTPSVVTIPLGLLSLVLFFREATRIWGWRLEFLPEGVRVRRYFRWTTIPWDQIHSVSTLEAGGRNEVVVVQLSSQGSERLGSFGSPFARRLRDRLGLELARRRGRPA
jgi:hypothetical protein